MMGAADPNWRPERIESVSVGAVTPDPESETMQLQREARERALALDSGTWEAFETDMRESDGQALSELFERIRPKGE